MDAFSDDDEPSNATKAMALALDAAGSASAELLLMLDGQGRSVVNIAAATGDRELLRLLVSRVSSTVGIAGGDVKEAKVLQLEPGEDDLPYSSLGDENTVMGSGAKLAVERPVLLQFDLFRVAYCAAVGILVAAYYLKNNRN